MHPNREPPHRVVRFLRTMSSAPDYPNSSPVTNPWPEGAPAGPPDPDAPTFPAGMTISGVRGQSITPFQIPASATGGPITSYGASNLPPGLSVDTTTGIISGTPTTVVTNRRVTVRATNTEGTTSAVVLVTVSAPGVGPTPTPPWAGDLTHTFPNVTPFNIGTNGGLIPLTNLTGWDPAYAADFTDAKLYPSPLHTAANVPIKMYATFTPPGTPVQVDFDATSDVTPAAGINKITMWGFSSADNAIYIDGSNSTGQPIALRIEKP